ncbi:MAG TPA: DUF4236 domain-containing protein [Tepidisphaeraceae bacterium]|jgi:hypothetical protein|nr:DUF4236 domain-containing protein [Tepidisphaeraceae bacterium]
MGWSFQKSINLGKGLRVNLSKRGIGLSGGVKGFRVSTGPNGPQLNAGAGPLRYRSRLGGKKNILQLILVILAAIGYGIRRFATHK